MNNQQEIWKDIPGYEGLYQVSNFGRVKNNKDFILTNIVSNKGYEIIGLNKKKQEKKYLIHRLVAMAFIPNIENKRCVDHIDTNKLNNNVTNLRWCSQKENINNKITILKKKSKIIEHKQVKCIETGKIFFDITDAAKNIKGSYSSLSYACRYNRSYKGYHWEYVKKGAC